MVFHPRFPVVSGKIKHPLFVVDAQDVFAMEGAIG